MHVKITLIKLPVFDLLEVLTVGIPFCGFKILTGLLFWNFTDARVLNGLGALLIGLGILDLLMNGINLIALLSLRRRAVRTCFLEILARPEWTWNDLGNSLDVLLSFSLVSVVIGWNLLKWMSPKSCAIWGLCVVFNVMGAGLGRFGRSLRQRAP